MAIHQPNFLPWLGFFDKIRRSDVFVVMDNAQFSKTGGTWTNRVQMMVNKEPAWVTVPIDRAYHGLRTIREMRINDSQPWRAKLLRTLEMNYGRAPYFKELSPLVREVIEQRTSDLAEYNLSAIRTLCTALDLATPTVLGSTLRSEGHSTDLLIAMVQAVGGTAYLAGGGAAGYQEDHKFRQAGIDVTYQEFQHPVYAQLNTSSFKPGLSIVDALMNCGLEGVRELFQTSARKQ
ncbi:MAG TPA: wbmP [Chloroflexi bacterium]|nr:wbmP [Chloroflexota bacterium]